MVVQSRYEGLAREAFAQYVVEQQQRFCVVTRENLLRDGEISVVIEYVQCAGDLFDREVRSAERNHLVEHRQRVAHPSVGLLGDDVQRFVVVGNALLRSDVFEILHPVLDPDAVEIVNLATGQYRG